MGAIAKALVEKFVFGRHGKMGTHFESEMQLTAVILLWPGLLDRLSKLEQRSEVTQLPIAQLQQYLNTKMQNYCLEINSRDCTKSHFFISCSFSS